MSAPGHRFPFDPIRDRCGGLIADSATRLGIHHQTALKHQERGLSAAVADVLAQRLGVHPCELWDDWLDHANDPVPPVGVRRQPAELGAETTWRIGMRCLCGAQVHPVAEGVPADGGRRIAAAVVCDLGHRSTLTVTLEAA